MEGFAILAVLCKYEHMWKLIHCEVNFGCVEYFLDYVLKLCCSRMRNQGALLMDKVILGLW